MGSENYQFDVLSADLYGLIADNLTSLTQTNVDAFADRALSVPEKNRFDGPDQYRPDSDILKRLTSELGFEMSGNDEEKEKIENGLAYSVCKSSSNANNKLLQETNSLKHKKKKLKSVASRRKFRLVQNFVPDEKVEVIKDLAKPVFDSSSDSEVQCPKAKGKRKRKKTWKLRLKESSRKAKKMVSDFSDFSSPEPIKEEEELSSDEYVPTSKC